MLELQIFIGIVCGIIAACIASSKGRSAVGWFFAGFFLGIIGVIVAAVMSNLKEEEEKQQALLREQTRLRERLKQEQIRSSQFQQHVRQRLDAHDQALSMDTRDSGLLQDMPGAPGLLDEGSPAAGDNVAGGPGRPSQGDGWYCELGGQREGPFPLDTVLSLRRAGTLHQDSLVWHEELGEWKPFRHVFDAHEEALATNRREPEPSLFQNPEPDSSPDAPAATATPEVDNPPIPVLSEPAPPPGPVLEDTGWYYDAGGQRQGPFTLQGMLDLRRAGTVQLDSLVWHQEIGQWKPFRRIFGGGV